MNDLIREEIENKQVKNDYKLIRQVKGHVTWQDSSKVAWICNACSLAIRVDTEIEQDAMEDYNKRPGKQNNWLVTWEPWDIGNTNMIISK